MKLTKREEDLIDRLSSKIYGDGSKPYVLDSCNTSRFCKTKEDVFNDRHATFGINQYRDAGMDLPQYYVDRFGSNEIAHVSFSKSDAYVIEDESHHALIETNSEDEISDFIKAHKDKYRFAYNGPFLSFEGDPRFVDENDLPSSDDLFLILYHHYSNVFRLLMLKKDLLSGDSNIAVQHSFIKLFFSYFFIEDNGTMHIPFHKECFFGYREDDHNEITAFLDLPDSDHRYIKTNRNKKDDLKHTSFYGDNVNECFENATRYILENYDTITGERIK